MARCLTSDMRCDPSRYRQQGCAFPMPGRDVEQDLCRRWRDRHDITAAHRLFVSHRRLLMNIVREYRGYCVVSEDLIGEAELGLMRAVCRFDPDHGVRFSTYAQWWVRAAVCRYILEKGLSVGEKRQGKAQETLSFNLRRACRSLQSFDNRVDGRAGDIPHD